MKDQLQWLGEVISDSQLTTCVLNALPSEWSSFLTKIYSRKDSPNFNELWTLCILEVTRLKAKDDTESNNEKSQAFVVRSKKKIGKLGRLEPHQKYYPNKKTHPCGRYDMSKVQFFLCNEYGHFERDCPKDPQNMKNYKSKERSGAHIVEENEEPEKKMKNDDHKDIYY